MAIRVDSDKMTGIGLRIIVADDSVRLIGARTPIMPVILPPITQRAKSEPPDNHDEHRLSDAGLSV